MFDDADEQPFRRVLNNKPLNNKNYVSYLPDRRRSQYNSLQTAKELITETSDYENVY